MLKYLRLGYHLAKVLFGLFAILFLINESPRMGLFQNVQHLESNLPVMTLSTREASSDKYHPIIRLVTEEGDFFCSAFVVSKDFAITAGHCIDEGLLMGLRKNIHVFDINNIGTNVVARGAGINRRMDTGLLIGDFSNFNKLGIEPDVNLMYHGHLNVLSLSPLLQKTHSTCGYPLNTDALFCNSGTIKGTYNFLLSSEDMHVWPGMSGGPLVNAETGVAVGINSQVIDDKAAFAPLIGFFEGFGISIVK